MAFKMTPEYKNHQLECAERARLGTEQALRRHKLEGAPQGVIRAHEAQLASQSRLVTKLRCELAAL